MLRRSQKPRCQLSSLIFWFFCFIKVVYSDIDIAKQSGIVVSCAASSHFSWITFHFQLIRGAIYYQNDVFRPLILRFILVVLSLLAIARYSSALQVFMSVPSDSVALCSSVLALISLDALYALAILCLLSSAPEPSCNCWE